MLIIGGYTERMDEDTPGKARGISVYDFFPSEGRIQFLGFTPAKNPSYVITDRKRSVVYAALENDQGEGAGVSAHKVNRSKQGKVWFDDLGKVDLPGDGPCHLSFAKNTVLVSSYGSGHLHVIRREEDGSLGEIIQTIALSSEDTDRGPHAHCTAYHEAREQVFLCDKGDDKLKVFDRAEDGTLTERPELALDFQEHQGPRHITLHPDGQLAVVNAELIGHVHLIDLSGEKPLRANRMNYLPERVLDEASGAAIRLSTNGKMIYTSDRTYSVVTALRIDEKAKKIVLRDTYPSGGESPRDLNLSPSGEWLLTANTADHTVGVFRVDPRGALTHYHTFKKVPSPTCFAWL
ncbi:lactonase family protein [Neolewinella aurantiaca]|uniref:Lactonase family protein n=1 Tax=Neolewinella aurantiaca TaxID=2602767 RepID=A0A5C7FTR7_9BACT|nr:beta-propeller fold lactonase family protein [Neolewinella aurantiaca]TXF89660.1 lactonase family protein [Neolewinella aurantiaca]